MAVVGGGLRLWSRVSAVVLSLVGILCRAPLLVNGKHRSIQLPSLPQVLSATPPVELRVMSESVPLSFLVQHQEQLLQCAAFADACPLATNYLLIG